MLKWEKPRKRRAKKKLYREIGKREVLIAAALLGTVAMTEEAGRAAVKFVMPAVAAAVTGGGSAAISIDTSFSRQDGKNVDAGATLASGSYQYLGGSTATAVPEPSTVLILGCAAPLLWKRRRR